MELDYFLSVHNYRIFRTSYPYTAVAMSLGIIIQQISNNMKNPYPLLYLTLE